MPTINGSPSSVSVVSGLTGTVNYAIPAGVWTAASWVIATSSNNGQISTPSLTNSVTFTASGSPQTVPVGAAQLADINTAEGANLAVLYNPTDSGSYTASFTGLQLVLTGTLCTFSIAPTSASFDALAHTGQAVAVTASDVSCPWTGTANDSWLHVTAGSPGTGSGNLTYSVDANTGPARSGSITIAGQVFSVMQSGAAPPVCTYALSPTSAGYTSGANSGTFSVLTQTSCVWTAVSNAGWITITSGASGTGPGVVGYSVSANGTGSTRVGTITAGGQTFTVTQTAAPPVCTYALSPAGASYPAQGGTGGILVTTQIGCAWSASSGCSWVHITGQQGSPGSGNIQYSVDSNYPAPSTLPTGNVAYWKLEETGTATRVDSNANALDLTPSASLSNAAGIIGQGVSLPGNGTILSRAALPLTTKASFSGWVKPTAIAGNQIFVSEWDAGTDDCFSSIINAAGKFTFYIANAANDTGNNNGGTPNGVITAGAWTHIIITFDGSGAANADRLKIYINGTLQTLSFTGTIPATLRATATPFRVGGSANQTLWFGGVIDELATWNRALTAAEVTELYAGGVGDQFPFTTVSASRTCNITAGGQTFVVSQAGSAQVCTYAIDANQATFDRSGGSRQIFVTSQNGCPWNATANDPWLHIVSGNSGVYPTNVVTYSVDPNGGAYRVGSLTVAGFPVEIDQSGSTQSGGVTAQRNFIFVDRTAMHERKILPARYFDVRIDGDSFSLAYQVSTLPADPTWIMPSFGLFNFAGVPTGDSCEMKLLPGNHFAQQEIWIPGQAVQPVEAGGVGTCVGSYLWPWKRGRDFAIFIDSISSVAPTPTRIVFMLHFFFDSPEGV